MRTLHFLFDNNWANLLAMVGVLCYILILAWQAWEWLKRGE